MLNLWPDRFESQLFRLQVLFYFNFVNLASNLSRWALLFFEFKLLLLLSLHLIPFADPLLSIFFAEVDLLELFLDETFLDDTYLKIGSLLPQLLYKLYSSDVSTSSTWSSFVSSYKSDPNMLKFIIFYYDYATSSDNLLNVIELFLDWIVSVVTQFFFE